MAWIDNIKSWTGLSVEESIRMTKDRDKWRKYVHGVANPRVGDGQGTEQNRIEHGRVRVHDLYTAVYMAVYTAVNTA